MKKVNFKSILLLALFTALSQFALAQRAITGTVSDASSGETLVGASVVVTGTTKGTLTDVDGKYELQVPDEATSLTFSYTGYASLTIPIGNSKVVDAKLQGGSILDEVVVVGYGTVRKVDATGAVNSISEKDFNRGVVTSPEQLMQGRAAGVQITQNSGQPGGGINVRIRGTSSVRGGNNPLFVIDGVPLAGDDISPSGQAGSLGSSAARNPLNFLNPDDIEKIDVLKDASATAIYGARGANGVVLITTKKGKGKGSLEYGYALGVSSITKRYDLLSASEYVSAVGAAQNLGSQTDWQDVVLQTGLTNNHNVSYGGSSDKGSYRFSFNYIDQEGIFKQSGFSRYSARFNGDQKFLNDRLTIGVNLTAANTIDNAVPITDNAGFAGDLLAAMLKSNPTMPIYKNNKSTTNDCDTCTLNQISDSEPNPAALLRYSKDRTNTIRTMGSLSAEFKIIDGLSFKSVLGFDKSESTRKAAFSRNLLMQGINNLGGRGFYSTIGINNSLWDNYVTYNKSFGSVNFTGLVGYSYQGFNFQDLNSQAIGFPDNPEFNSDINLMLNNAGAASKSLVTNSSNRTDELQSYFARVNFSIKDKYLLTASIRRDGSTRFSSDKTYGNFPSFAFKWRLSEESFIPKNMFSDLGLRIGYGVTGNQEFGHNLWSQRKRYADRFFNNDGNIEGGGFNNITFRNFDLQWESTAQTNVGLDFGFMNNRISGSVDWYDRRTDKLLLQVEAGQPSPQPFVWQNLDADLQNTGVELTLNIVALDNKDFKWNVSGNVAYNKNVVNNFGSIINTGQINGQGLTGAFAQRIAEGQPLGAFLLREFGGYDSEGNTIYPSGDFQQFLGKSGLPTLTGGITNSFSYKGFDLSLFFNGVFGNWIYNNTANAFFTKGALANGRNVTKDVVSSKEGPFNAPDVSTRFLEKGDFVRLSNLTLSYRLPVKSDFISGIRFFVVGQNLLTFTDYTGQDPEVNTNKQINGVPSFGIDYTAYPRARTWTIGANVSF
jgi:iron complex outermembrane receptor protein